MGGVHIQIDQGPRQRLHQDDQGPRLRRLDYGEVVSKNRFHSPLALTASRPDIRQKLIKSLYIFRFCMHCGQLCSARFDCNSRLKHLFRRNIQQHELNRQRHGELPGFPGRYAGAAAHAGLDTDDTEGLETTQGLPDRHTTGLVGFNQLSLGAQELSWPQPPGKQTVKDLTHDSRRQGFGSN